MSTRDVFTLYHSYEGRKNKAGGRDGVSAESGILLFFRSVPKIADFFTSWVTGKGQGSGFAHFHELERIPGYLREASMLNSWHLERDLALK